MQQDGVKSLQSNRESLKEKLCLLIIGRDMTSYSPDRLRNCTADSLIGSKVSKAIGWNKNIIPIIFVIDITNKTSHKYTVLLIILKTKKNEILSLHIFYCKVLH